MTEIQEVVYPIVSHRAMAGISADDLYIIPAELADRTEILLSPRTKFVRSGGVYTFGPDWQRKDGEVCEEIPGMIYAMGHTVQVLQP